MEERTYMIRGHQRDVDAGNDRGAKDATYGCLLSTQRGDMI